MPFNPHASIDSSRPDHSPPRAAVDQAAVSRESSVGVRYVPTKATPTAAGDIEVAVEPAALGVIQSVGFKGERLRIQPTGLIALVVVQNKSDHIVDLAHSILQFEDDKGHEYAIEEGGWTGMTLAFIDSICDQYARGVSALTDQYRASLEALLPEVRARAAAAQRQNDDALRAYAQLVQDRYGALFANYVTEVNTYNLRNLIASYGDTKLYQRQPSEIEIDERLKPERLTDVRRPELAQANRQLGQTGQNFEADIRTRVDALRARLLGAVEQRRGEWKKAVQSLPVEATKVVRGNGRFDPIVIPPGKHRTLFVPGIRNIEGRERGRLEWPGSLILKLYDLPARTDQAARVTVRSNLEFHLHRELVEVFAKDESAETSPAR